MSENTEVTFKDKRVRDFLKNVHSRLSKVKKGDKEYVGLLSAIVFGDVMKHFENQEGPDGKWTPWSQIYKQHMNDIGRGGNKILQFTGRMRNNFKPSKWKAKSSGIMWFNDAKTKSGFPYAAAHDSGDGQLPQRQFMYLSDQALDKISQQTLQFMIEKGI